ncbi:MAG: hypothetical protein Q7T82_15555 [Armatimonadota bacterium]|nr:hypothetical protein [Armatimonadota bacterium]
MGYRPFLAAYRYRRDMISQDELVETCSAHSSSVRFSEPETRAFAKWMDNQVEMARETYPKDSSLALAWTEGDSRSEGGG